MVALEEFVFNVFVSKLQIGNQMDINENTTVKFDWGDDEKFKFELNPGHFDEPYNLEFEQNIDELIDRIEKQPFKLSAIKKKDKHGEDSDEREPVEPNSDEEIIGEADCHWPSKLIEFLKNRQCATTPFQEQYFLSLNERTTGSVTLSIYLYAKCVLDKNRLDQSVPYIDKEGNLSVFKQMENLLDPNDVFFVIGDPPGSLPMETNLLEACGGKGPCRSHYEVGRYQKMKGTLVNDCSDFIDCGSPDCCAHKDDDKICDEVLIDFKPKPPPGVCCMDPCERIFGPISSSCDGLTCTDLNLPCHSEFHTINCIVKQNRKHDKRKRDTLKKDKLNIRMQRTPTHPYPEIYSDNTKNRNRHCPVCCEDISSVPVHGICPKCGFTPKLVPPLEKMTCDETKTAKKILDKLNEAAEKCRKESKIGKFGTCSCTSNQECVNCKLRRMSDGGCGTVNDHQGDLIRSIGKDTTSLNSGRLFKLTDEEVKKYPPRKSKSKIVSRIGEHLDLFTETSTQDPKTSNNKQCHGVQMQGLDKIMKWYKKKSSLKRDGNLLDSDHTEPSFSSKISVDLIKTNQPAHRRRKLPRSRKIRKSLSSVGQSCCSVNKFDSSSKQQLIERQPPTKIKYYNFDEYPGVILGHKFCIATTRKIPRYMGWLWSASICEARRGWRPGAVRRATHRIMKYFQKIRFQSNESHGKEHDEHGGGDGSKMSFTTGGKIPKIKVTKKNGRYHVTVYPLSEPTNPNDSNLTPIEFTIDKDPVELTKRLIKSQLRKAGFEPCVCGRSIKDCTCRENRDRADLQDTLEALCGELRVLHLKDQVCFSDSTESRSELEMQFAPPAAWGRDQNFRKPKMVYAATQYNPEDIKIIHPREDRWNYDAQEFKSRQGRGVCGGLSRLPPCRPHRFVNTKTTLLDSPNLNKSLKVDVIENKVLSREKSKTQVVTKLKSTDVARVSDAASPPRRVQESKLANQLTASKSKTAKLFESKKTTDSQNSTLKKNTDRVETLTKSKQGVKSKQKLSSTNSPPPQENDQVTHAEDKAENQATTTNKNKIPIKPVRLPKKQTAIHAAKSASPPQPPTTPRRPPSPQPTIRNTVNADRQIRPVTSKQATSGPTRQPIEPQRSSRQTIVTQKRPTLHKPNRRRAASPDQPLDENPTIWKDIPSKSQRPVKREPCQKASLMQVSFRAHSCQRAQTIRASCPTTTPRSTANTGIQKVRVCT